MRKINRNTYATILAFTIALLFISGCSFETSENKKIATTFGPLSDATKAIVADKYEIFSVIPAGVEPHSYEPSAKDFRDIAEAEAFIVLGIGFEKTEERLIDANPSLIVIDPSKGIELLDHDEEEHEHEEDIKEETHEEEGHTHTGKDPHVWLSPKNMKIMATNIAQGMYELDLENKQFYEDNLNSYLQKLDELDMEYSKGLKECERDTILVNHKAFAYLANDYGFNQISISGLEPESEPTPREIEKLILEARKHDLKHIFYDELVDKRVSQTIAREVGAEVLELSHADTNEEGKDYFFVMRKNLNNLKIALECR